MQKANYVAIIRLRSLCSSASMIEAIQPRQISCYATLFAYATLLKWHLHNLILWQDKYK